MQFCCTGDQEKKKQPVSGVTTICLKQCNASPSHTVDQVVDCGLWNVCPLLFNDCSKLLDIGAVIYADPERPRHAQVVTCLVRPVQSGGDPHEDDEHADELPCDDL